MEQLHALHRWLDLHAGGGSCMPHTHHHSGNTTIACTRRSSRICKEMGAGFTRAPEDARRHAQRNNGSDRQSHMRTHAMLVANSSKNKHEREGRYMALHIRLQTARCVNYSKTSPEEQQHNLFERQPVF
eukprot:6195665-Pleurochrysis_carterae.AAC.1